MHLYENNVNLKIGILSAFTLHSSLVILLDAYFYALLISKD